MHINVRDLLVESVGYNRTYNISGERPEFADIRLTQDIEGEIQISRLDTSLLVTGQLFTEIELECDRCLRTFTRPIRSNLHQEYSESPVDDQLPIEGETIDIAPLAEQEIILGTPIKRLCRKDCPGIQDAAGKYTKEDNTDTRIRTNARITKGTKRGRT
ncbi:MAG: hypothetical protein NVSMB39_5580 [Candidatus Saccharimonadales bacterium]